MKRSRVLAVAVTAVCIALSPAAHSQDGKLTDQSVRQFMQEGLDSYKKPYAAYVETVKSQMHKDFHAQMDMTFHMQGQPPMKMPMSVDGAQMLQLATPASHEGTKDATFKQNIQKVDLAPDGLSASIKSELLITNQKLDLNNSGVTQLADSFSECIDKIVYTEGLGPQVINSQCVTNVNVKTEQDL